MNELDVKLFDTTMLAIFDMEFVNTRKQFIESVFHKTTAAHKGIILLSPFLNISVYTVMIDDFGERFGLGISIVSSIGEHGMYKTVIESVDEIPALLDGMNMFFDNVKINAEKYRRNCVMQIRKLDEYNL